LAQVRQLRAAGYDVRAISRSKDPFYGEDFGEVEIMPADLTNEASVRAAVEGVEAVFYTHPLRHNGLKAEFLGRIGRASRDAGVKRVVWNTSSWIPDRPGDPGVYAANTEAINALWRTGAPATVFGSVLFMDNLLTNWARPFIVREGRYVYPHSPQLEANWISLDDVAKFMIAALDRPDLEGAWMNIGGPVRMRGPEVAQALSEALDREIRYDPCSPEEFGRFLAGAYGDDMSPEERAFTENRISAFYHYNNTAPTRPFCVDVDAMLDRMPLQLETMAQWARRQDWTDSNRPRPPAG
ncbi:MAG: hypothetical protein JWQ97_2485, partial [Phenylobacterium sp.]|nr:hypothetical protein [Phenylobacterium sp.]